MRFWVVATDPVHEDVLKPDRSVRAQREIAYSGKRGLLPNVSKVVMSTIGTYLPVAGRT